MKSITAFLGLVMIAAAPQAGQGGEPKREVLQGTFRNLKDLEGGAYLLDTGTKKYDLHGKIAGVKDGDLVEVEGKACPDRVCFHMIGTVFQVDQIRKLEIEKRKNWPWPRMDAPRD